MKPLHPYIDFGDLDDHVFHYTGATALLGIVIKREFWASHSDYLNDRYEGKLVDQRLRNILKSPRRYMANDKCPNERSVAAIEKNMSSGWNSCMVSFSRHSNSLTQFRMYAPTAGGYSIGFPRTFLDRLGIIIECEYSDEKLTEWCVDYIDRCGILVSQMPSDASPDEINSRMHDTGLVMERLRERLRFKSDDFKNEAEVRLVNFGPIKQIRPSRDDSFSIPYNIISIPDEEVKVIITPGPSRDPQLARLTLEQIQWLNAQEYGKWELGFGEIDHAFRGG